MAKRREIRNSTAEFLIFQAEAKEQGVEVYYKDENIWATQKAMATLFDVNVPAISKHLKNIFESGELKDDSVVSKMEITASDGKNYQTQFYSLDAIIAKRIDAYLSSDERPLLDNAGSVSHEEFPVPHTISVEGRSLIRTFLADAI